MPRKARIKDDFCTYHILQRGNEKKNIFLSADDRFKFLEILSNMKNRYNFLIYVYCLMDNHIHLIINSNGNDISQIFKSINTSYAIYFNRRHDRCGHLFQDRFKSQVIYNDNYLLIASKYIHNNPVKAGITVRPESFEWSSYCVYLGKKTDELIDTDKILGCISNSRKNAINDYVKFVSQDLENSINETDLEILDIKEDIFHCKENRGIVLTVEQAKERIKEIAKVHNVSMEELLINMKLRNETIKQVGLKSSLTLKQLGEVFGGISESRMSRILNK